MQINFHIFMLRRMKHGHCKLRVFQLVFRFTISLWVAYWCLCLLVNVRNVHWSVCVRATAHSRQEHPAFLLQRKKQTAFTLRKQLWLYFSGAKAIHSKTRIAWHWFHRVTTLYLTLIHRAFTLRHIASHWIHREFIFTYIRMTHSYTGEREFSVVSMWRNVTAM